MTTYKSRGEIVFQTDVVQLKAKFHGPDGELTDLDTFPSITITQPSGNVILGPTAAGVYKLDTGTYGFDYSVAYNDSLGVWTDTWTGVLNGFTVIGSFQFIVDNTQLPAINTDGYEHLGDDPGFNYSQTAIHNINLLMKTLRARLDSAGKILTKDAYGNDVYSDCDIYSVEQLTAFLANSLTLFNEIPTFTMFTFEDSDIIAQFHDVIVQGAAIMALSSKSLIERGREYKLTDNGINFDIPTVSELMQTQWSTEFANHFEKVKYIKDSIKPSPLGLGTLSIASSRIPAIARLRHLRARRLY